MQRRSLWFTTWAIFIFGVLTTTGKPSFAESLSPYTQSTSEAIWYPNTNIPPAVPIFKSDAGYYLPFSSGLGLYSLTTKSIHIYPFPNDAALTISAILKVHENLWVVTRQGPIFRFDPRQNQFRDSFVIHNSSAFGANANQQAFPDKFRSKIWFSSFNNLDSFDIQTGQWKNHSDIFVREKIGSPSSWHRIAMDADEIWISGGAHIKSSGALVRCRPNTMDCVAYHSQLTDRRRLEVSDFLLGKSTVWVLDSPGNVVETRISEYDRSTRKWTIYPSTRLATPAAHMLAHVDDITPSGILVFERTIGLAGRAASDILRQKDHPYQSDYLESVINESSATLAILRSDVRWQTLTQCPEAFAAGLSTCHTSLVDVGGRELKRLIELPKGISYQVIVSCEDDYALVSTSSGMARFSETGEIDTIQSDPLTFDSGHSMLFRLNNHLVIGQDHYDGCGDDGIPPNDYYEYLPESNSLVKTSAITETNESSFKRLPAELPKQCRFKNGRALSIGGNGLTLRSAPEK